VLLLSSEFYRRFVCKVRDWPLLLLWLVYRLPDVVCEERRAAAKTLLTALASELNDVTVLKFRIVFKPELEEAVKTGNCETTNTAEDKQNRGTFPGECCSWAPGDVAREFDLHDETHP